AGAATSSSDEGKATDVAIIEAFATPVGSRFVWLTTSDRFRVAAWYWEPDKDGAPGVILLHMRGRDKSTYADVAPKMVDEGYAVIAIDFRGHGQTLDPQGRGIALDSLTDEDYQAMQAEVAAAHDYLDEQPEVDANRVGIVGASIGANLAMLYAAGDLRVRTVVALSPGLDFKSLTPLEALDGLDKRPLYLLAAKGDKYSHSSSQELAKAAVKADPVSMREFEGSAHGTDLLEANPGLDMTIITGWLLNYLPPKR
ncbi:alpha/beta fold hydrolase, partial [bacterium]|nr:alpha/beta fold hydrolase [bacterium]